ncbi:MAG: DUF4252 domain-containing protein [Acidobacteriia bacterium]|nr:DUF4252 domain-containing protein [Terriglobia bacterium]
MIRISMLMTTLALAALPAQDLGSFIEWDKLSQKAAESVNVNLEGTLLELATRFLSSGKNGGEKTKKLLNDLKGIHVRSLKFDKEGEYSLSDVDKVKSQLKGPEWSPIVDVRSSKGGDNAGVYIKTDGKQILGIVVLAAEPKELTLVEIKGSIDPEQLRELGGKFGIPDLDIRKKKNAEEE